MENDDFLPRSSGGPLEAALREDLDPLSDDELHKRIAMLESEIARTRARIARSANHRLNAEALFRKS